MTTDLRGHVQYVCNGACDGRPGCQFCDGGLFACTRCGAFEGATPDDCPGKTMTPEQSDQVYAGTLNYRDVAWRIGECNRTMLHIHRPLA
jgi:hypothetical protein